jgi:thymidylate synthase
MQASVAAVFPKPFCSLTEDRYNWGRQEVSYTNSAISEFARHFGRPRFTVLCSGQDNSGKMRIEQAEAVRDAPCGFARAVAEKLAGTSVKDATVQTGLLQHHYPCLATMRMDPDIGEPLIQVSGGLMRRAVEGGIDNCSE